MKRERDSQRAKFWAADDALRTAFPPRRLRTVEAQAYLQTVVNSRWWRNRFGRTTATLTPARSVRYRGSASNLEVLLPPDKMDRYRILKVLAWVMIPREAAYHGREFAKLYCELVTRFDSPDAGLQLKALYKEHRIKWQAKRKISPERMAQLKAQGEALADHRSEHAVAKLEDTYRV